MTDKLFAIRERHDAVEFSINRSVDGGHGHLTIDEAEAAHEDRAELLNAVTLAETARDLARKNAREGWSAASKKDVDIATLRASLAAAEQRVRALEAALRGVQATHRAGDCWCRPFIIGEPHEARCLAARAALAPPAEPA